MKVFLTCPSPYAIGIISNIAYKLHSQMNSNGYFFSCQFARLVFDALKKAVKFDKFGHTDSLLLQNHMKLLKPKWWLL